MADDDVQLVLGEAKDAMDKSLRGLRAELQKIRTGRANPSLLEGIQVDYYGTMTPLPKLANLTLIRQSQLSVMPLTKEEFDVIVAMGK